jgi:pyruvate dehydrogenase E1 component beta subunit
MRELSYAEALREAIREEMLKNPKVIIFGEDIGKYGGAYKVTKGLLEEFGPERVIDTPISEAAILGFGIGLAIMGFKPIAEIMYMDFIPIAIEQILNHAAKMHFMSGGQLKVPLVIRTQYSLGRAHGSQHSQFFPSWFMNIPGLLVALPSTPYDAKGLLKTAIRLEDPVLFIECCLLYHRLKGPVPEEEYTIPFGKADIKREGEDLTIVAISRMVHEALIAAEKLSEEGISAEVIDPRTLNPFDKETIINSIKKTGKLIIASDDHKRAGVSSEIAAIIAEEAIDYLDAPIIRVCSPDIPIPFSPQLEKKFMRSSEDIIFATKKIIGET